MNLRHHDDHHRGHVNHTSESQSRAREQQVEQIERESPPGHAESGWKRRHNALREFWTKVNNDWVFNLSGLLAYNLLMSIFPILLVLIAAAGFVLHFISPGSQEQLVNAIAGLFPQGQHGAGGTIVSVVLDNLRRGAGIVFIIGLLTAVFAGSRLFITIESCVNVIFRLRPRDALHQNIMAFLMLLLYIVLIPVIFLASSVANATAHFLLGSDRGQLALLVRLSGIGIALAVAIILFAAIYIVVPNRPVHVKEVWRGTLTGAALLVLYELVFPVYQSLFLKPSNYGSIAGFAIVILVFFYYFAFILLLGAEVNSWFAGQRATAGDIPSVFHEVQAHDTTRGAAGPTAGTPTEDIQSGKGKAAMRTNEAAIAHERLDHKDNAKPPMFAEANAANSRKTAREAERTSGYDANRPMHRPEPSQQQNDDGTPRSVPDGDAAASGGAGTTADGRSPGRTAERSRMGSSEMDLAASAPGAPSAEAALLSGPARPEYAHPLLPAVSDMPPQRPRSSMNAAVVAIAIIAIPVLMWLFGRRGRTS
jgi:YihY family inner membrane protein